MKNITTKLLVGLKARMLDAYESADWQLLAELDVECQRTVTSIISEDPRAMFDELREMLGFYKELIQRCQKQRDQFAADVRKLRQGRRQQDVYNELSGLSVVASSS